MFVSGMRWTECLLNIYYPIMVVSGWALQNIRTRGCSVQLIGGIVRIYQIEIQIIINLCNLPQYAVMAGSLDQ